MSLLNHDRSTLTVDEWGLLSNVVHAYDEQNLAVRTQWRFKEQSSLPAKLRSKPTSTLELIGLYFEAMQPFIERAPHFHSATSDIRKTIVRNNMHGIGAFNSLLAAAEANVYDNENHVLICNDIYGIEYVAESYRVMKRIEPNRTLVKLLLVVLAFSSNCSIVSYDRSGDFASTPTVYMLHMIQNQNLFVTMLWKYLLYQYGHAGAVRRFDCMIKNYLDTLNRMNANVSTIHWQMIDDIVEKTAQLVT